MLIAICSHSRHIWSSLSFIPIWGDFFQIPDFPRAGPVFPFLPIVAIFSIVQYSITPCFCTHCPSRHRTRCLPLASTIRLHYALTFFHIKKCWQSVFPPFCPPFYQKNPFSGTILAHAMHVPPRHCARCLLLMFLGAFNDDSLEPQKMLS